MSIYSSSGGIMWGEFLRLVAHNLRLMIISFYSLWSLIIIKARLRMTCRALWHFDLKAGRYTSQINYQFDILVYLNKLINE